jgi:non-homologous end joining protein Ku
MGHRTRSDPTAAPISAVRFRHSSRRPLNATQFVFDTPYYLYPDGPIAVEGLRVIGAAMAQAGVAGIGRLTLSRRERMAMVEPRGIGLALFTLRAADEVRPAQLGSARGRSRC